MSTGDPLPTPAPQPGDSISEKIRKWLITVAVLVTFAIAVWQAVKNNQPIPPLPPLPQQPVVVTAEDKPEPNAFGWTKDPEEVKTVLATMLRPVFATTPAGQSQEPLPAEAFLWDAYKKLFGRLPPVHDQNPVGSCVSFGSSRAYERSLAVQIVRGEQFEYRDLCEEAIYALSRVEIGGGRIRGDGSVGVWAAKGFTVYGGLPRGIYDVNGKRFDLSQYDPGRCREWGRYGLPDALEPEAKRFPAGDCAQVKTIDELKRALSQGYGVFICSGQGFTKQRDQNGICRASGSWSHCMACDGYHIENGRTYFRIENSWGPDYHVGPTGWGNPNTGGFYAEERVVAGMLSEGDSFAVSAVKGFPAQRPLDWLVKNEVRPENWRLHVVPTRTIVDRNRAGDFAVAR